ncbi:MAG: hypothetical protein AB1454_01985 [Candidatus Auribacterota bacterium]
MNSKNLIKNFFKSSLFWVKKIFKFAVKEAHNIIFLVLAIVGFLYTIQYFTTEPEIEVSLDKNLDEVKIPIVRILEFYENYNFIIPDTVKEWLNYDTQDDVNVFGFCGLPVLSRPGLEGSCINFLRDNSSPEHFSVFKSLQQETIKTFESDRVGIVSGYWDNSYRSKNIISKYLFSLKDDLDIKAWYIFASAVIDSKTYKTMLSISNKGEVDAKNLKINIVSPINLLTGKRDLFLIENIERRDSLKGCQFNYSPEKIAIFIPEVKAKKGTMFFIYTKQSTLSDGNVYIDYDKNFKINKKSLIETTSIVSISILALYFFKFIDERKT